MEPPPDLDSECAGPCVGKTPSFPLPPPPMPILILIPISAGGKSYPPQPLSPPPGAHKDECDGISPPTKGLILRSAKVEVRLNALMQGKGALFNCASVLKNSIV